jgi:hypothetical protein
MADDTYSRGYRNDPHGRGGTGESGPGADPLTELARLIGQSDPFSPDRNRQPDPRQPQSPSDRHADAAQHAQPYETQHYDSQQHDHGTHDDRYAAGEPQQYADQGYDQYASHQNGYPYPHAGQHEAGYGDAQGYAEQPYHRDQQAYQQEQPAYQQDPAAYHHQDPQPQAYAPDQPRYAQDHEAPYFGTESDAPQHGAHGAAAADPHAPVPGYPTPSFLGSDPNERPDEYYEDAPAPRRGWLVTAAALVGLAVIGTAGAFAYRSVFTGGEARIITRDVQPSKITPALTNQDANKPNERLASANQNERLGPPPEQPVTIPEPPRTVPPALSAAPASAPTPVLPPASSGPNLALAPADNGGAAPRRVRTEKINPQQVGDVSGPRPATQPRTVGPTPIQPAPPPTGPNAPLSLAPQGIPDTPAATAPAPAPAPTRAPPTHTTAVAPPPPTVERNSERSSGGGSGYYVQVSAHKSEEEAKSTFRGIAARHASLLGGQQMVVRRKDLGSKGIFYGAQVGPLSREAAGKLCEGLKAAGQGCMVQRN